MTAEMLLAWIVPLLALGGLVWNASRKFTLLEHSVRQLEKDNRELRAEIRALERLIKMFVEKS
jgi:uncharacterized protein YlxW (UPF0749 family)